MPNKPMGQANFLMSSDYVGENNVNFNAWNIDLNFNYWFAPRGVGI